MSQWQPRIVSITVIGGTGEAKVSQDGVIFSIGVIAPANAIYDLTGLDSDGFLLYFGNNVSGNINMAVRAQIDGNHTVRINDTTTDGVYKVKLWYENY